MDSNNRRWLLPLAAAAAVLLILIGLRPPASQPANITLDELQDLIAAGQVVDATITQDLDVVEGTLAAGVEGPEEEAFRTEYPDGFEGDLTALLLDSGVRTTIRTEGPGFVGILIGLLPFLLIIGLFVLIFRRARGGVDGIMGFRKAQTRQVSADQPRVTFADVAGVDEAVQEVQELRDFLADPARFRQMGARIPKGVLLVGPPGTGKTLLARAIAGEAGVPFLSMSGSEFVEMFVGVGAGRVRDLFEQAKKLAPAIVFIDEIDAVGRSRGTGLGGGNDEREQTLNQLLVEMDGFAVGTGVIVIAATNRPDVLDPALLRPGRFDRQIVVDQPDLKGRRDILRVHAAGKPLAEEVDLDVVARRTPGFTGADLANLLNEATLLATRRNRTLVGEEELEDAVDKVIAGPERRGRVMSPQERRVIAYHEAGHALVGWALPGNDPLHKVTIISRGRALGYTQALPTEDRYLMRESQLLDQLAMLVGGRAAEELVFGDPTTGSANDLEKATAIGRRMVEEYGMSRRLGLMQYGSPSSQVFLGRDYARQRERSEASESVIDDEVRELLDRARLEAGEILSTHRDALDAMATALIERETVNADEITELFGRVPQWHHDRPEGPGPRVRPPEPRLAV